MMPSWPVLARQPYNPFFYYEVKDDYKLIKVTKAEVEVLRKRSPRSHIAIVNRQSSHKKYYVEENRETTRVLRELRGEFELQEESRNQKNRQRGPKNRDRIQ